MTFDARKHTPAVDAPGNWSAAVGTSQQVEDLLPASSGDPVHVPMARVTEPLRERQVRQT
jgi:hypothetical protein